MFCSLVRAGCIAAMMVGEIDVKEFVTRFAIVSVLVLVYYRIVVVRLGALCGHFFNIPSLERRYPARELNRAMRLVFAGILQMLFALILMVITRAEPHQFILNGFRPTLLIYGAFLGLGEMALASFICHVAIQTAMSVAPAAGPRELRGWFAILKGGWMQSYFKTMELAPLPWAVAVVVLYVSFEELIFRAVLINYFRPAGAGLALGIAAFFFLMVQTFHMPSWRAALFPVIGATVLSVVHGSLFLAVPNILPLIVAHFVFFFAAITGSSYGTRPSSRAVDHGT
jgi:membrane protease YdiL (CAAX protease family)